MYATCNHVSLLAVFLQSGLSEPDKDENKPTSDSDDGYSKDLVTGFLITLATINSVNTVAGLFNIFRSGTDLISLLTLLLFLFFFLLG